MKTCYLVTIVTKGNYQSGLFSDLPCRYGKGSFDFSRLIKANTAYFNTRKMKEQVLMNISVTLTFSMQSKYRKVLSINSFESKACFKRRATAVLNAVDR